MKVRMPVRVDLSTEIRHGYCKCACGSKTRVVDGTPRDFILGHSARLQQWASKPLADEKNCSKCGLLLLRVEFEWASRNPPKLHPRCRECRREKNRKDRRQYVELYWQDPDFRAIERSKARKTERKKHLTKMGISVEQYNEMLVRQEGVCAICREPETIAWNGTTRQLSLDHDHEHGTVRGLLCSRCNTAIGLLRDEPALLIAAAKYLKRTAP